MNKAPKKRSVERGYMTQEEISNHLKNFSDSYVGSHAKIDYLTKVLDKEGVLAPETQKNVRRVLAELYIKDNEDVKANLILIQNGGDDYAHAIQNLKNKASGGSTDEKTAEALASNGELVDAARIYSRIGNYWRQNKDYKKETVAAEKAVELYERAGELDSVASNIVSHDLGEATLSKHPDARKYAALLEKAADSMEINSKLHYLKGARERYENAGSVARAVTLGKKIGQLEQKLEAERANRRVVAVKYALPIIIGIGLVSGAFFTSTKLTGNVIGLSNTSSSLIGVGLLIIGFVAGYFWAKDKNKNKVSKKINKK